MSPGPRHAIVSTLLFILSIPATPATGAGQQAPDGDVAILQGAVRSQAGEPLVGAAVVFEPGDLATATDSAGRFRLEIPAGRGGRLGVRAVAFAGEDEHVDALLAGAVRSLAVTLVPLYRVDALTVVGVPTRPLLNTESAETGGAVDPYETQALPTDAREPLSLAFTIPGVAQSTGFFGDAPPLTINGANSLQTQYLIDGLDNNEGFLGGPRVEFPLSGLSRLEAKSSTFSAGFGRTSSGVVNYETKAGASEWRGDVFSYWRPGTPIDSDPPFAPPGTDPDGFRRYQLGGSVGGPIAADRTFVFLAAEYENEREDRIGSTARASFIGTEIRETVKLFARVDHGWTDDQTTTLQFAVSDVSRAGQGGGIVTPEADITTVRRGTLTALTHRSTLGGGRAVNSATAQLGTFRWDFPPTESDLNTPQVTVVSSDLTTPEAVVGSSNFVFDESELQLQLRDVLEVRLGAGHTLRTGADVVTSSFELFAANTNPNGAYTVVNEGNIQPSGRFLSIGDVPADVRVLSYSVDTSPATVNLTQTNVGAFIEDQWRATSSLTLRAGIRWDYDDITSRGESSPDLDNFQPRISAAWNLTPESVLRGGAGIYTGKFPYAVYSDAVQFGSDGNATVTFAEDTNFQPPAFRQGASGTDLRALRDGLPPREIRLTFARGLEQPFSYQASAGYQRQFGRDWGLSVDGVMVLTRNLPRSYDLNAIDRALAPGDTIDRSPEFGDAFRPVAPEAGSFRRLTTTESAGRSNYWGLYTTLRRRFSGSLSAEASWVLSGIRTNAEDINFAATVGNDFAREYAPSINDRRHHVTLRGIVKVSPRLAISGIADYQTGTPINRVAFFRDLDGSGAIFGEGFVGNADRLPGVPRNAERLPGEFQLAFSASFAIDVLGNAFGLRADVFNLFNSTIETGFANGIPGGGPRTQVGRPGDAISFGQAGPPRQFQFAATYAF
ncbi:MAG: TonB-dependent receptor plug domain-containing protein [Gemmatimonadota bacterium]